MLYEYHISIYCIIRLLLFCLWQSSIASVFEKR